METSFPGHITTVDQEEPPRQMGRGEDREPSRTISAGFPPRSGFVQPDEEAVCRFDGQHHQNDISYGKNSIGY